MTAICLNEKSAAAACGVSEEHFRRHFAPHLGAVDGHGRKLYLVEQLQAYIKSLDPWHKFGHTAI